MSLPQRSPLISSGMTRRGGLLSPGLRKPQRSPLISSGMTQQAGHQVPAEPGAATEPAHFERDDAARALETGPRGNRRNGARSFRAG